MDEPAILVAAQQREDALMNHRLSWTMTFQGILFAAFSLVKGKSGILPQDPLLWVLPLLGITVGVLCAALVILGNLAIARIRKRWGETEGLYAQLSPFDVRDRVPRTWTNWFGLSFLLPCMCVVAWGFLLPVTGGGA